MAVDESKQIRIQILGAKEEAGAGARAVAAAREHIREVAAIGRGQGAEALLVCPAPEEFTSEGIDLVIGARFGQELDEDTVFWRQRTLAGEIDDTLRHRALVLDLDRSFDGFVKSIAPLLASPYRDEIGGRSGGAISGI
jgi:hypothetical protein